MTGAPALRPGIAERSLPQVALEAAARFEGACLAGVRGEMTTYRGLSFLIEPFLRLAFPMRGSDAFVRLGVRMPLGPKFPLAGTSMIGFIGGTLEGGVLF